jgi:hypothetical protein
MRSGLGRARVSRCLFQGWVAGVCPERLPFGRLGERPPGSGAFAGVPTSGSGRKGSAGRARVAACRDPAAAPMVDGDHRSPALPGAIGLRRPRRTKSSGRLAAGAAPVASSTRGSDCRSAACAPGRSGGPRIATAGPSPGYPDRPTIATPPLASTVELANGRPRPRRWYPARSAVSCACCEPGGHAIWGATRPRRAGA